jgi:hypothetical protein
VTIVVISNPASRRNRHRGTGIDAVLTARADCAHHVLEEFGRLGAHLEAALARSARAIVLNGGDGTVQAALTHLLSRYPAEVLPPLAILAGGTTNAIAAQFGRVRDRAGALRRLLRRLDAGDLQRAIVPVRALRVDFGSARAPEFGMLFGAAGITRGIRYRRALLPQPWVPDALGAIVAIASLVLGAWIGSASAAAVLRGETITIEVDGQERLQGAFAFILATTLERIVLGARPFWGRGAGAIRFTSIAHPVPRLLAHLPTLLYGGAGRSLPAGYQSRNATRIGLTLESPVTLDGEFFEPQAGMPVTLTTTGPVRFLKL